MGSILAAHVSQELALGPAGVFGCALGLCQLQSSRYCQHAESQGQHQADRADDLKK
jgi:hypothetical protein